jgi:hypothetical protein
MLESDWIIGHVADILGLTPSPQKALFIAHLGLTLGSILKKS